MKLAASLGKYARQTDQPTDRLTNGRGQRQVSLPIGTHVKQVLQGAMSANRAY